MNPRFYSIEEFTKFPSPRFIQTHLPYVLLPRQIRLGQKKPKLIYLMRNVKDVCVAYSSLYTFLCGFVGTLDEFCSIFLSGKRMFIKF